jgi:4-oxalocrotonate tautomerase
MPTVTIDGPIVKDMDKKRELVKAITDAMEKAYGMPRHVFTVVIKENSPENVGVGGTLIIDR